MTYARFRSQRAGEDVPGGSANAYEYAGQDPVNTFDLDGRDYRDAVWHRILYAYMSRALDKYWNWVHKKVDAKFCLIPMLLCFGHKYRKSTRRALRQTGYDAVLHGAMVLGMDYWGQFSDDYGQKRWEYYNQREPKLSARLQMGITENILVGSLEGSLDSLVGSIARRMIGL